MSAGQKQIQAMFVAPLMLAAACSPPPPTPPLPPAEQAAATAPKQAVVPPDVADRPYPSPLSASHAEQILTATDVFDMAGLGFRPGRQVQAFNVLLDQPDAGDRFHRLARTGRPAGQLYALCGLLLVDRGEAIQFTHSFSLKPGDVTVRDGDYTFDTPIVRAIVLVFAHDLPKRLRDRRDEAYAYFTDSVIHD